MSLVFPVLFILLSSGVLMAGLHVAYKLSNTDGIKVHQNKGPNIYDDQLAKVVVRNAVGSGLLVLFASFGLSGLFIDEGPTSWLGTVWQILATLLLYDVLYYLMHRFPFHEWKLLHKVHVVHHTAKHPTAVESLYMHPIENFAGLALLLVCTWIVGPVSVPAYIVILAVYSYLNIVIHCALDFRSSWLRPIAFMIRKHDRHHKSMRAGNYASITPLPDILFGTLE